MDKTRSAVTPERFASGMSFEQYAGRESPFLRIWACAGIDEILSALDERLTVGARADA